MGLVESSSGGLVDRMVKRKRNTSAEKSGKAVSTTQVACARDEEKSENIEAEPERMGAALGSGGSPDDLRSTSDGDQVPQGRSIDFKHDSILRVSSRSAMSASSSDEDVRGTPKRLAVSTDEGSNGGRPASCSSKDAGAERPNFTVLRNGETFGTHFSLLRVEMSGVQLSGAAWLSVIEGSVGLFGAVLDPDDPPVLMSSAPLSSFIMTLTPHGRELDGKARLDNAQHPEAIVHSKIRKSVTGGLRKLSRKRCIVLLTAVSTSPEALMASDGQQNYSDVFHSASVYPSLSGLSRILAGTKLLPTASIPFGPSKFPVFQEWQNLSSLTQDLESFLTGGKEDKAIRVLVCGASGTGKSTLTRYLVNHLLLHKTRVVLIDTDVGQPEMNPPGLLAAHAVSDFRLGAPTSSIRSVPISARFLGETTPREEPDLYSRLAKEVIEEAIAFADTNDYATVINSDGWVNGVGAELLHHVAEASRPTHIVQLKFPDQSEKQSITEVCAKVDGGRSYTFESLVLLHKSSFTSSMYRDSQTASYFSKEVALGRVYKVPLVDLQVASAEDESADVSIAHLVNGSIVALGGTRNPGQAKEGNCKIMGLGIVRGVDLRRQVMYLCSPVPFKILSECDKIVISGGMQLPPAFITTSAAEGDKSLSLRSPYLLGGGILSGNVMRSRKTLNRR